MTIDITFKFSEVTSKSVKEGVLQTRSQINYNTDTNTIQIQTQWSAPHLEYKIYKFKKNVSETGIQMP